MPRYLFVEAPFRSALAALLGTCFFLCGLAVPCVANTAPEAIVFFNVMPAEDPQTYCTTEITDCSEMATRLWIGCYPEGFDVVPVSSIWGEAGTECEYTNQPCRWMLLYCEPCGALVNTTSKLVAWESPLEGGCPALSPTANLAPPAACLPLPDSGCLPGRSPASLLR
jgi:hypothetical protein